MSPLSFSITEDEAKEVHRSLKIAAGIFKHLKVTIIEYILNTLIVEIIFISFLGWRNYLIM